MADDEVKDSALLYDDLDEDTAASFSTSSTTSLLAAKHAFDLAQLQTQLDAAKAETERVRQQLQRSESQRSQYATQCAVFARNISLLFDTAVAEVKRKNEEIDRLSQWKEVQERRERQRTSAAQQQPLTARPPTPPPQQPLQPSTAFQPPRLLPRPPPPPPAVASPSPLPPRPSLPLPPPHPPARLPPPPPASCKRRGEEEQCGVLSSPAPHLAFGVEAAVSAKRPRWTA